MTTFLTVSRPPSAGGLILLGGRVATPGSVWYDDLIKQDQEAAMGKNILLFMTDQQRADQVGYGERG